MLVDDVSIRIKAGDGGNGFVHFFRNRSTPKGGPDGGNGGKGGDIYFQSVSDITRLKQFRFEKKWEAEDGQVGGPNRRQGKRGNDLVLYVPVGTVVAYDNGTGYELTEINQKILAASGGEGGLGNDHFKSSTNTTPQNFTPGIKTQYKNIHLQLKLIAQIGLIGLPNAGKSSLLNALTKAKAQVANYPFTTLEPNLGVLENGKIVADIPGLIEGASEGKGLGAKFLRHVERTQLLVHCLACDQADPLKNYQIIRQELENYSSVLAGKPEIIVLTKTDLARPDYLSVLKKSFKNPHLVSIFDNQSLISLQSIFS